MMVVDVRKRLPKGIVDQAGLIGRTSEKESRRARRRENSCTLYKVVLESLVG